MKKFILTVALVLAVVTSLVAGTMAAYTQQLDATSKDIIAKTFSITKNTSDSFSEAVKVAPGESVTYQVTVKNAGEVDAALTMGVDLRDVSGNQIDGLAIKIDKVEKIVVDKNSDKSVTLSTDKATGAKLAVGDSAVVTFTVTWAYATDADSNARDNADMAAASSYIQVAISATGLAGTASPIR